jgi:hypothetical protein
MSFNVSDFLQESFASSSNDEMQQKYGIIIRRYSIHGAFQYRHQCRVCNRQDMTPDDVYHHVKEPGHQERVDLIHTTQRSAFESYLKTNDALALEPRIDKLGLQKWKDGVKAILFDLVAGRDQLSVAEELLEKYEDMERISSLELAIWVHACIQNPTKTESNDALHWHRWFQEGWKENKDSTRHSPAISGIIPHVLPFLGVQRYKGN